MEVVLFIGVQATGKSSFYHDRFRDTHLRLNLDMLRTRRRERLLFDACLAARQPVVIDNTNPTPDDRARYIVPAKEGGIAVVGYFFRSRVADALARNAARPDVQRVPEKGVLGTASRLVLPRYTEGFDRLYFVSIAADGFEVAPWNDDV